MARASERLTNNAEQERPVKKPSRGRGAKAPLLPDFDPLIHERMRLGIVSALSVNDTLSFTDLKRLLNVSDGNLSVHARKLEEAGYISCSKFFEGRVPRTEYKLTPTGRQVFQTYLKAMEQMIHAARQK